MVYNSSTHHNIPVYIYLCSVCGEYSLQISEVLSLNSGQGKQKSANNGVFDLDWWKHSTINILSALFQIWMFPFFCYFIIFFTNDSSLTNLISEIHGKSSAVAFFWEIKLSLLWFAVLQNAEIFCFTCYCSILTDISIQKGMLSYQLHTECSLISFLIFTLSLLWCTDSIMSY